MTIAISQLTAFDFILAFVLIVVMTTFNIRILFKNYLSGECLKTDYVLKLIAGKWLVLMTTLIISAIPIFAFFPQFFVENIHKGIQVISYIMISEILGFLFAWILKGQNSPLMNVQKQT